MKLNCLELGDSLPPNRRGDARIAIVGAVVVVVASSLIGGDYGETVLIQKTLRLVQTMLLDEPMS